MGAATVVFTICAANYLARARALGTSLRRHHPEARFVVGLVDRLGEAGRHVDLSGCEILEVEALGLAPLAEMRERYEVLELLMALKPFYLERLLEESGVERLIYLDTDTRLYAPLDPVHEALRGAAIVLTPHLLTPPSVDFERAVMRYGVFNLGFVALARTPEASAFLAWWRSRLLRDCLERVSKGWYLDQLVVNPAPVYFPGAAVLRDPGVNVAWWNLYERPLARRGDSYAVGDGAPLRLFHFSHYDPCDPKAFAKLAERARAPLGEVAEELYRAYGEELLANGHRALRERAWALAPAAAPAGEGRALGKRLRRLWSARRELGR